VNEAARARVAPAADDDASPLPLQTVDAAVEAGAEARVVHERWQRRLQLQVLPD
jgi:hypothetical protein